MSPESRTPLVFISYSHDTREHKQWVLSLAQRLLKEGIDVILDQWDLEYGTDVPAFMAHSVGRADRVLMICTETYVQKVDEGKGGVGYEALIVTGELIQDLGTKKFVPVIRQSKEPMLLPKKLGPRMAVNLSDYSPSVDEEFKNLVAQLRQQPPSTKPPLGEIATSVAAPLPSDPISATTPAITNPTSAYDQALKLARSGDMVSWRRVISGHRAAASKAILEWRAKIEQSPPTKKAELPPMLWEALTAYQPLFASAVSAIESAQPKFNQQGSLIHDLMEPKGWQRSGSTIIIALPDAAAWVFQALAGAMYVHTAQIDLALDLATQRIPERYSNNSSPLYLTHDLVGWPESLDTTCTVAWQFLNDLPQHFPWIATSFNGEDEFREALAGYYLMLSWLEYLSAVGSGHGPEMEKNSIRPDVPPLFINDEPIKRGMLKLLEDRGALARYSVKAGVSLEDQKKYWAQWVGCLHYWLAKVFNHGFPFRGDSRITHFAEDVAR